MIIKGYYIECFVLIVDKIIFLDIFIDNIVLFKRVVMIECFILKCNFFKLIEFIC